MKPWRSTFTAIVAAETLAIAGFATSIPIIPLYLQDLGIDDPVSLKYWTGLIQSATAISLAVFAPIWGSLADSYGKRLMLLRAMIGGAFVVGLMGFVTNPWQLLALRVLQGCLTGTVAAATVLVAGLVPAASAGFALGILQTGVSMGNSLGPLIGGVVSDFLGRRAVFFATSLLLLAAGFITMRGVENDRKDLPSMLERKSRIPFDYSIVFRSPVLFSLLAVIFTLQMANSVASPMLPLFIQQMTVDPGRVGSTTGIVLGAGAAAAAVAATLVGRFSGKLGYTRTLLLCLAGGALFTLPQAFSATPFQLAVFRVLSMLFLGGAMPAVNALIAGHADRKRQGGVFGLSASVASIGLALGPAIGSLVAAAFDYRAVFVVTSIILALTVAGMRFAAPALAVRTPPIPPPPLN